MKKAFIMTMALVLTLSLNAFAINVNDYLPGMVGGAESVEIKVVEDRVNVSASFFGKDVIYVAEVINESDKPVTVTGGEIELLDKEGAVVNTLSVFFGSPNRIEPGQKGYVSSMSATVTDDEEARLASHKARITGFTVDADAVPFSVTASDITMTMDEQIGADLQMHPKGTLTTTLTNTGTETAYDIGLAVVVRDKDGKLLTIAFGVLSDVGIPAGGKVFYRQDIGSGMIEMFDKLGTPPAQYEAVCYPVE